MTLQLAEKQFHKQLLDLYSPAEITAIWHYILDYYNISKTAFLLQKNNYRLTDEQLRFLNNCIIRLKKQEPIQYIVNVAWFMGFPFFVNKHTLIPRPETEELVNELIEDVKNQKKIKILDIGTGSGCIAISLAKFLPNASVLALDISQKALEIAQKNAEKLAVKIDFLNIDILDKSQWHKIPPCDIIISNPPYIRTLEKKNMHSNVLNYEPQQALFVPNEEPLIFYQHILDLSKEKLNLNGAIYFEINQYLSAEILQLVDNYHFNKKKLKKDLFKNNRMIILNT